MKNKFIYTFLFVASSLINQFSIGQVIYQHAFGTSTFTAVNPYTAAPNFIDGNLNSSQWSTSVAAGFTTFGGSTGQALSVSNSSGTPTYSLNFTIAPGFTCSITDFSFWRQRSAAGAQGWTLSVNGATTIGTGTVPTTGANTGTLAVSNPLNNLSGTVNVVLQLGGASGAGTFRLDDFTLYGVVNPTVTCTPPTIQATTFSVTSVGSNSVSINWTPGNGGNVIVLASAGAPVSGSPSSGNSYTANTVFGFGQQIGGANYVVYNSTGSSVTITGLSSLTTYYFSVFEYNTASGFPCYLAPALTGSATLAPCTPPTTQASSFNATAIGTTSATINWTAGSAGNAIVLARSTTPVTSAPISGTSYASASTVYGNGGEVVFGTANYLVYDGTGTSVTVTNLNPGTTYYFEVFEYNVSGVDTCYLTPGLTGSITALVAPVSSNCLQIKSILVNACDGTIESYNEMVYFKNGSNPLPINQLSMAGAPKSGVYAMGKWPNNSNIWNGAVMNATTAANVSTINSSINNCGYVLEPPLVAGVGTIPPNAYVILVGSQVMSPTANSFTNLTDTIYMIFQTVSTTTAGNFVNWSANNIGTRGLVLIDNANACTSNTVTYEPQLLLNHADGDGASYNSDNTVSYYNNGCQAPYTPLSVDVSPNQTICYNSQTVLTATPSGVYNSISWSGGTGIFSAPSSLTTTYTPGAFETGTVNLVCTITRSCATSSTTASNTVAVSIISLPIATLSATNGYSLCPSTTSIMSYSVTNAANAGVILPSWSSPAGASATYTVTAPTGTAPVTYTLDLTNACGAAQQTFTVTPLVLPTVSLSLSTPSACAGSTLSLSASGNTGNYSWNNPVSTNSIVTITANLTSTGVVTSTNTCGSVSDTYTLTVIQNPAVSVDNANLSLCTGQTATITATSIAGNYVWQPGGAITNTLSVNSAGVYTVTSSNICFTTSATSTVNINSTPTLSIASTSSSLCLGGQLTTTLSLTGSTGTYSWSSGGTASTETISTPGVYSATVTTSTCGSATNSFTIDAISNPSVTLATNTFTACAGNTISIVANSSEGNYAWSGSASTSSVLAFTASSSTTGIVTTTNVCASASDSYTITVISTPTLTVDFSNVSLCTGQTATITATSSEGNYSWLPGSTTTNTLLVNSAGVYTVTTTNNCFTTTATTSVTLNSSPTLTISSTSTSLCASGQTATLSLSGSSGVYNWSDGSTNPTLVVNAPGVYTATITTASCGSATQSFTVNATLTPTISLSSSSNLLCNGSTATLTASTNMSNEVWSSGSVNTNSIVVNAAGTYTVGVSNACGSPTAAITIQSNTIPSLSITPSATLICPNETATLTVTGGSVPYSWSNSSNIGSVVTTSGGTVTVSSTNACGTGTASIVVNVISLSAGIIADPTTTTVPAVVNFTNTSSGANSYIWSFGNGNTASTQIVSSQSYSVVGTYTVSLMATNGLCSDTYSLIINVINEEPILVIPNVFTPNGDSINDIFKVSGFNIIELSCTIFDRWGLKMYSWDGLNGGWNGKTDGKAVPDGTYFYIINAKDINDKEIKKQGPLSLFK